MSDRFDERLLLAYMHHFYGFGNYAAPYWFIGMEEGGGDTFSQIARRLEVWEQRGSQELEDVAEYHIACGITRPFDEKPKLQPTWAKLIRVLLTIVDSSPTREEVRAYQREAWARSDGIVNLMELLPLPSPSTRHWLYAAHSTRPDLESRKKYRQIWSALRIKGLRQRIQKHTPRAVIFYGSGYLDDWNAIVGVTMQSALSAQIHAHRTQATLYVAVKHPAAQGITSEYFHDAGRYIRLTLANKMPT